MNFAFNNVYHVHPEIMRAIVDANARLTNVAFCNDADSYKAEVRGCLIVEPCNKRESIVET